MAGKGGNDTEVHRHTYTYDLLGKLLTRADANTSLSESFEYDALNRLTKSTVSFSPTPWIQSIAYNAVGNITFKSDVGTYSYPAPGSPKPHGVTSISGGVINTTFTYDAEGNMTSGNGLTVAYTSYNAPASITRGTASISFDPGLRRGRARHRAPALFPGQRRRDDPLPGGGRGVRRALRRHRRRGAVDQLPHHRRAARRRLHPEGRRDHRHALPPPARGQAPTPTTWAPSPSSPWRAASATAGSSEPDPALRAGRPG
jgi:YD repeat-containing protein